MPCSPNELVVHFTGRWSFKEVYCISSAQQHTGMKYIDRSSALTASRHTTTTKFRIDLRVSLEPERDGMSMELLKVYRCHSVASSLKQSLTKHSLQPLMADYRYDAYGELVPSFGGHTDSNSSHPV
ncbi:hypothetical protein EG68_04680 [Paragonimus skrjabini miyazakii]|uniref:Uncharacterized protein n=1 Tax=Paragonimus skrjabini miyazakii TaxID=59628 RepID=A0A8S9YXX2_9TREM|nr:hypothetical protein EG68_04680 [Paragonimus skrjabini miyazakii]